jgi:hypothetical protein
MTEKLTDSRQLQIHHILGDKTPFESIIIIIINSGESRDLDDVIGLVPYPALVVQEITRCTQTTH